MKATQEADHWRTPCDDTGILVAEHAKERFEVCDQCQRMLFFSDFSFSSLCLTDYFFSMIVFCFNIYILCETVSRY